ncbi:MAG: sigma-70 family RNA polymerase sigma factor, partial [Planctomycetota bacterium]
MTPQASTEELFCRYRQTGDSRALTEVFDRTAPELLALASHLAGGLVEAEDLVQHTFLVAIEKARRFKAGRELLPWLAGILIREAQKQRRNRSRRVDPERVNLNEAPEGERIALNEELRTAVTGALGEIPAKYQGVLRPFLLEGMTAAEIAKLNSSAAGTVRVQLHRGLDLLRRALPTGIGLGVAGVVMPRGLGNVRLAVEASAIAAPIAATSAVPFLSLATVMTTKTLVLGSTLAGLMLGLTLLQPERSTPEVLELHATAVGEETLTEPAAPTTLAPSRLSLKSEVLA